MSNQDDYLSVYVYKITLTDYNKYVDACRDKGFTIEADQSSQSYYAYNADGYKISLYYNESDKKMHIGIDAAEEYETLVWPDSIIASMLPVPISTTGKIIQEDEKGFQAYISNTPFEMFKAYTAACYDVGFNIEISEYDKSFSAKNNEGYKISVSYQGNNVIFISVNEPEYTITIEIKCVENLIFSKYDVDVYIDDSFEGTITHGDTEIYELTLPKGTHILKFVSDKNNEIDGEVEFNIQKDESLKYEISCSSSGVDIDFISETNDSEQNDTNPEQGDNSNDTSPPDGTDSSKITVTMSEDDFIGMLYTDAEEKLHEMGFNTFEHKTIETEDITKSDDTIAAIEIKNWALENGDFTIGDTFESDAIVVLWYYICHEPEPNLTVENCPELADILSNKAEIDASYSAFASKYSGQIIEFDGRIDYCTKHGDYNTRFDYLVSAGDYDPDHQIGPCFKFENVNYYDLNTDLDTVSIGLNVRIVAEVLYFDSISGLFYLKPVAVTGR